MKTENMYQQYASFKEKRLQLANMLTEGADILERLNMQQYRENLLKLSEKVENEAFKVQILGTFKNGKSTFINALLGEEVLPAYALPCTAIVNEVKWGEEKRAVVHFRNPLPEPLTTDIPEKALEHMKKYDMKDIPPIEIPYDEIRQYAVITLRKGKEELEYESPYEKIEVFWPLPLLQNGVEIIDSPGLNECATRTNVTMNYLTKADAVLFVLDATRILSADEMHVIEHTLKDHGFTDPFIIVNKFDVIRNREKEVMKQYVRDKLEGYTTNEFFFVSGLNALDGKLDNDLELLESSGLPEFEASLSNYLVQKKGAAKINQPSNELQRILNEEAVAKNIPMQRNTLATSLDEVKGKYEREKPRLDALHTKKEQLLNRLMLRIEQVKPEFRRMMTQHIAGMMDKIPAWISGYTPTTKLSMFPKEAEMAALTKEISEVVNNHIEQIQTEWRSQVLEPVLSEKTEDIFGSVEADLERFFEEIDRISVEISGQKYETEDVPAWQRVAGVIGGLALGDVGIAISGGINGFSKDFAKSFAIEVGAVTLLSVLGMLNPFTILLTLGGLFVWNAGKRESANITKVKDFVCQAYIEQLSNNQEATADGLCEKVGARYKELAEQIAGAMDKEIAETENQINGIIAEMEKGKEHIAQREQELEECQKQIADLTGRLDELKNEVAANA